MPPALRAYFRKQWDSMSYLSEKHALGMLFTQDVVNLAKGVLPEAQRFYGMLEKMDTFRNDFQSKVADIAQSFEALTPAEQSKVNEILETATVQKIWPYGEEAAPKKGASQDDSAEIAGSLRNDFLTLSKEAQAVVRRVFEHGQEVLAERRDAVVEATQNRYDELIESTEDAKERASLANERDANIKQIRQRFDEMKDPYVPLRRFGKYVVTLRSKEYVQAKALAERVYKRIMERTNSKPTAKQMEIFNKYRRAYEEMEVNSDDYIVETFDSMGEAKAHARELEAQFANASVQTFESTQWIQSTVPAWQKLEQVALAAQENFESKNPGQTPEETRKRSKAIYDMAVNMYIRTLADQSARKSELRRRTISGWHSNMMENFVEQARGDASNLANVKYGTQVRKAISDMVKAARKSSDREKAVMYQNELLQRYDLSLNAKPSKAVEAIMRTTSMHMLLTNPAFYLQNATQPFMMSAPYMAGEHGAKAFTSLASNYAQTAKWLSKGGSVTSLKQWLSKEEYSMLDRARDAGHIDIGITQDFGRVQGSGHNAPTRAVIKATDKLTDIARKVEIANRVATFLTAYRLEKARGASAEAAYAYADNVIYETHGDYSGRNAPRYFRQNDFAKVATQFRKFQLIQLGYMARLLKDSFKASSPQERAVARSALKWTLGVHLATAGMNGTPFGKLMMGLAVMALGGNSGGEDDEETIRRELNNKPLADILMRGFPTALGVDLSEKVGAGNMLELMPYYDYRASEGRQGWYEFLGNAMGPAASIGAKAADGARYMAAGDYWKGMEQLLPTGLANTSKALRTWSQGITTRSGDVMIPGEEFSVFELAGMAAGVPLTKTGDRNRALGDLIRHENYFDDESTRIRNDYRKAVKSGDRAAQREARQAWKELNALRKEQGFKPVALSTLLRSARDQRKREHRAIGGVPATRANRSYLKKHSER